MNLLTRAVAVDNVTINKTALGKLQTVANTVMQYADGRFYVGSFTRDVGLASGTQEISLPLTPKTVIFWGARESDYPACDGASDGTNDRVRVDITAYGGANVDKYVTSGQSVYFYWDTSGNGYYGTAIMGLNKFTMNWIRAGVPTGTMVVNFLALR